VLRPRRDNLTVCLLLMAALLLPTAAGGQELQKVSVRLQWQHQAQFAGLYLAQDLGLYAGVGLDVQIWPYNPLLMPLDELATGGTEFALAWLSDALVRKGQGQDIVQLAQVVQRSALMLVARRDSGIGSPQDLQGRRVGMWVEQFAIPPRALFKRFGLQVVEISQSYTVTPLLAGAVDAATAMRFNEYHQYYQAGLDYDQLVVMDFAQLGLNFPEDGIYAAGATWQYQPDLCRGFTRATMEGWRLAREDPQRAFKAVMDRIGKKHLGTNSTHQRWMLKVMDEIITPADAARPLGSLDAEDLERVNRMLLEQEFLKQAVPAEGFVTRAWEKP
jgi:NitT/TauT family transport system substrate-binding protein